ncbi:MAG: DUF1405 domain-containing protein [Candidatus Diapherotrites archaeon]|nr:DUF1405 domain-containing protein [Candidatus Diapherotrites archaeon]
MALTAKRIFENKKFLVTLALINFAAGVYSIQYYLPQLSQIDPLLWLFVADCPLYSIIFGTIILLGVFVKQTRSGRFQIIFPFLLMISIVGNLKYGFWTVAVFLISGLTFGYEIFFAGHLLLMAETIVLFKKVKFEIKHLVICAAWFLLNDTLDYAAGLHPYFDTKYFLETAAISFVSTILFSLIVFVFFSKSK